MVLGVFLTNNNNNLKNEHFLKYQTRINAHDSSTRVTKLPTSVLHWVHVLCPKHDINTTQLLKSPK